MLGLLGVGLALILGIGIRLASIAGILQVMLIYLAQMMPLYNPVVDEHVIYSLILLGFVFAEQPVTFGAQKWGLARKGEFHRPALVFITLLRRTSPGSYYIQIG